MELFAILGLVFVGLAVCAVFGLILGLLKIGFKLLLLPLTLAWGLFKIVLVCGLIFLVLALAPAVLAALVVAVPLIAIVGLVGVGWAVFA
jgi:hypothetical protein